jgi:hypothetical protein
VSAALMLILSGAVAGAQPSESPRNPAHGPPASAPPRKTGDAADEGCHSENPREIVVCAERRRGYRLDPRVMDAAREAKSGSASATSPMPVAQATCAAQPMGCGKGLEGLDLANVALVGTTMAVRAAEGKDWKGAFKKGRPDEYQLYLEAKKRREAHEAARAAQAARLRASQDR